MRGTACLDQTVGLCCHVHSIIKCSKPLSPISHSGASLARALTRGSLTTRRASAMSTSTASSSPRSTSCARSHILLSLSVTRSLASLYKASYH